MKKNSRQEQRQAAAAEEESKGKFELNGKGYKVKPMDFNALCFLERAGVDMSSDMETNFNFIRAYMAYCMNVSLDEAGNEIFAHVKQNGWDSLSDIFSNVMEEMNEEGFSDTDKKPSKKTTKA